MKRISGVVAFCIAIVAFSLYIILESMGMELVKSKAIPITLASFTLLLSAVVIRTEVKSKPAGAKMPRQEGPRERPKYLQSVAWLIGYVLAIYVIGMLPSTSLLTLLYCRTHGSKWIGAFLAAAATTLLIYLFFERALQIVLYRGIFF